MTTTPNEAQPRAEDSEQQDATSSKRFRFKRKSGRIDDHESDGRRHRTHHHGHHRHHRHRSKRYKSSATVDDNAATWDDSVRDLPPDVAFRESLFDALGDDEGAAFWQGVYGQPIHNYSDKLRNEETGELEQMSDDEYATYVRRKMWEKSWEGIEAAREETRKQEKECETRRRRDEAGRHPRHGRDSQSRDNFVFDLEVEQSLKRGEKRRDRKRWKLLWEDYLRRWEDLLQLYENRKQDPASGERVFLRNKIAWPVESGKRKDVTPAEVERFIHNSSESISERRDNLASLLKAERIRFHPDKIQQRFGFMDIDESTLAGVTAVFQIFDAMWNELRTQRA